MYRIRIATLCWVLTFSSSVMAQSLIVPIWPNEDLVCKPEKAEEIEQQAQQDFESAQNQENLSNFKQAIEIACLKLERFS